MLRDFVYNPDGTLIQRAIERFSINRSPGNSLVTLVQFTMLSPDSFLWKLVIDRTVYYLYAEDFVEGVEDVLRKIRFEVPDSAQLTLVKVKIQQSFSEASPVTSARVYRTPEQPEEMMQYAASSGYDFVFLCQSDEDPDEAYFNASLN